MSLLTTIWHQLKPHLTASAPKEDKASPQPLRSGATDGRGAAEPSGTSPLPPSLKDNRAADAPQDPKPYDSMHLARLAAQADHHQAYYKDLRLDPYRLAERNNLSLQYRSESGATIYQYESALIGQINNKVLRICQGCDPDFVAGIQKLLEDMHRGMIALCSVAPASMGYHDAGPHGLVHHNLVTANIACDYLSKALSYITEQDISAPEPNPEPQEQEPKTAADDVITMTLDDRPAPIKERAKEQAKEEAAAKAEAAKKEATKEEVAKEEAAPAKKRKPRPGSAKSGKPAATSTKNPIHRAAQPVPHLIMMTAVEPEIIQPPALSEPHTVKPEEKVPVKKHRPRPGSTKSSKQAAAKSKAPQTPAQNQAATDPTHELDLAPEVLAALKQPFKP